MSDTGTRDDTATGDGETQALPGDGLREGIVDDLRARIGEALLEFEIVPNDDLVVRVATEAWAPTAAALKAAGFSWFGFLSAIDWMPSPFGKGEDDPTAESEPIDMTIVQGVCGGETRMQVFARLTDLRRHVGITIKADVDDETPVVDSWTSSFAGANWHERECHEMFGIGFNGHPDLRHMYLPGEFEGFPLRKDFPLVARMVKPWPGIVDVEPMPEVVEEKADEPVPVTDEDGNVDAEATAEVLDDSPSEPATDDETPESSDPGDADAAPEEATAEEAADPLDDAGDAPEAAADPSDVAAGDVTDDDAATPDADPDVAETETDAAETETTDAGEDVRSDDAEVPAEAAGMAADPDATSADGADGAADDPDETDTNDESSTS